MDKIEMLSLYSQGQRNLRGVDLKGIYMKGVNYCIQLNSLVHVV